MPSNPPTTTDGPAPLMTHRQASHWLGISERSLDRIKRAGGIPYLRLAGRTIRYRPESLAAWATAQETRETIGGDA